MEREITCFFTGHRDIPLLQRGAVAKKTEAVIRALYERGFRSFVCGGAVGYDQLCAEVVLRLKKELPIELRLILPCEGQDKYFSAAQKAAYAAVRARADEVEVLFNAYTRYCMHARNRRMADVSSVCVAYCTKDTGGTAYTVGYAASKGLEIIRI